MHPFPPAAELQFLVGLEVGQICLDPWSTQLRFADGGRIMIEGPFDHQDADGQVHAHQAGKVETKALSFSGTSFNSRSPSSKVSRDG